MKITYLCVFLISLFLEAGVLFMCFMSGVREEAVPAYDFENMIIEFLLTFPLSIVFVLTAVISLSRYRDKKENEDINKFRQKDNSYKEI